MTAPAPYYQDDHVTLYHGDCLELLPHLDADVLVTDPPYGMGYSSGSTHGDWSSPNHGVKIVGDESTASRDAVLDWWGDRPALVFGTWKRPAPAGVREMLVWDKVVSTGMGALAIPWKPSWEAIYVMGDGFTGRRGHGVLRYSLPTLDPSRKWHPTPKPVSLMVDLLSKTVGVILDPFAGSGSTLRAAKDLGRRAIGIEIDKGYCDVIVARLAQEVLL